MTRDEIIGLVGGILLGLACGLGIGYVAWSDTPTAVPASPAPLVATVTLAPNGMAYCPTDPAVVHVTPCVTQP